MMPATMTRPLLQGGSLIYRPIKPALGRTSYTSRSSLNSSIAPRSLPLSVPKATNLFGRTATFPKRYPFAFNLIVATYKTSAADIVVQTVVEGKDISDIDWKRNAIFIVFGFSYLGGFQWWLLINKYKQWFPTMERFGNLSFAEKLKYRAGMQDAMKMVLFDVVIHAPIIYFPTYYSVKECVGGTKWNPIDWVVDGVTKYRKNMTQDLIAMAAVTIPSDCLQVALPIHIRMIVRHFVSFFWTSYISFSRGAIENHVNGDN